MRSAARETHTRQMDEHLALAAERGEAEDLNGLARHVYAAAREVADIDAFHLLVYHANEEAPMNYILFGDSEKTWAGARHEPGQCPGDSLALELRRTVDQSVQPLPYGDAFNIYPSQLYVPILHLLEPIGVLCVMAGIHDFFTAEHRRQYDSLAAPIASLIANCLHWD